MASEEPPKGRGNASGCVAAGGQAATVANLLAKAKSRTGAAPAKQPAQPVPKKVVSKAIPGPVPAPKVRISGKSRDDHDAVAVAKKSSLPRPPQPKMCVPVPNKASKAVAPVAPKTSSNEKPKPAGPVVPKTSSCEKPKPVAPEISSTAPIPTPVRAKPADEGAGIGSPLGDTIMTEASSETQHLLDDGTSESAQKQPSSSTNSSLCLITTTTTTTTTTQLQPH